MPQFLADVDLVQRQLIAARIENRSSAPSSPLEGQVYVDTTTHTLRFYNGTSFIIIGRLDQITAPTADVDINSHKLVNVTTPSGAADAATKGYVDGLVTAGTSWKNYVRAATTANGALATAYENADTLDGVTLATGDRILIKDQSTGAENGIYTVNASGAPTRATDADAAGELVGATVWVSEGTVNADSTWTLTTNAPITVNTTALVFVQISGLGQITSGAGLTKTGNTLDVVAGTGITVNANDVALTIPVVVTSGGTGATTLTNHGVLLGQTTAAVVATAVGANNTVLHGNTGADPTFSAVSLTADVTGTLPVGSGGTGVTTSTNHGVLVGQAGSAIAATAAGATGTVLHGAGASADPTFSAVSLTADVSGTLPVANGGTNATTVAAAKTSLGFTSKFETDIGDGSTTAIVVTHNLGTRGVVVNVSSATTPWAQVIPDVAMTSTNTVTITFTTAPTTNQYHATVIG